jgi:hypothetical protein
MLPKNCQATAAVVEVLASFVDYPQTGFDREALAFIVNWVANRVVVAVAM